MSWRFRKRVTLFPGVTLNFSKSGISTTFGVPGASINIGNDGVFFNAGIPGSGVFSRSKVIDFSSKSSPEVNEGVVYFQPLSSGEIRSADTNSITSDGLKGLKETLIAAYEEEKEILNEISRARSELLDAERRINRFRLIPFAHKLFPKRFHIRQQVLKEKQDQLEELKTQLTLCKVNISVELDENLTEHHNNLLKSFDKLKSSNCIWDIVTKLDVDRVKTRSAAYQSFERKKVQFSYGKLSFINSKYDALLFKNHNGADLYIYPGFLVFFSSKKEFSLIDLRDLMIKYSFSRFIEEEQVPKDARIIDKTWAKVNKDGSRDKRFANNYEIPIVLYGQLDFLSNKGLNEKYMFSNDSYAKEFSNLFYEYNCALAGKSNPKTKPNLMDTNNSEKILALKVLGLGESATTEEIKSAYYSLIKKYHPDKVVELGDEIKRIADEKTKELNRAYDLLIK